MIKVDILSQINFTVELDVESFNSICEDNMSIEESDKMLSDAVFKKYGIELGDIIALREKK